MTKTILLCSAGALALIATPAIAKSANAKSANSSGAQVAERNEQSSTARQAFTPADFERFAPRNALDMARQIPGFSIQQGGGDRGLGQADTNVLINGQRISGKSNGPVAALQRIPAEEVVRLEIVEGSNLDIPGLSGQVLNVLTKSTGGVTGLYRYSAEWRSFGVPFRWGDGQVSLAGGGENTEWTLSLENDAGRRGNEGIERVFDAANTLIDTREEQSKFVSDRVSLSGSFARTADNGNILNLTGQVLGDFFDQVETSQRSGIISSTDRSRLFQSSRDAVSYEIGADYAFDLGDNRLKLIAFHSFKDSPSRSEVITNFADDSAPTGSLFARDTNEGETILRSEYTSGVLGGDIQVSLEGARNFIAINSTLEVRDADGILERVTFAGASARVDEDRVEANISYSRAITSTVSLQTSFGGEYSQISQSGPFGQTRDFWRPKGFVSVDWRANDSLNLSVRAERDVGQLNFFDFIATTNLDQDRVNVANADLVPPQSWRLDLEATQSLDELGSINVRGFYRAISDIVDQIPIEGGGQAPGNIDSASQFGVDAELTLLSDPLGHKGLRLDTGLFLAESEVIDPLLGTPRNLSGFRYFSYNIDIRQDLSGTNWAFGGNFRTNESRPGVRLDEISQRTDRPGFARVFIENKDILGLTARFRVGNLINQKDNTDRTIFTDRLAGVVDFREESRRVFGTIYSLDLEGSF